VTADFYDERLATVLDAEERYQPLYEAALELVPPQSHVVELGSGSGRFAAMLLEQRAASYIGIDFAPETTTEARRYVGQDVFRVDDLRTCLIPPADVYVSLEVLEHLEDDLALIKRLPRHAWLVLSVPSFPSASHVRWFPEIGSAVRRYEDVLKMDQQQIIPLPSGAFFHLLRGRT
jgi:trans-aconitate methyltransferase